jgi:protease II
MRLNLEIVPCGFVPSGRAVTGQTKGHLAPPPVKPVTTDYYGTKVVDPYRYMENLKDPKVQAWMKAQNDYTRAVLARIPGREKLLARIRQLDQSVPQVRARRLPGDRYLILKSLPGESAAKLYLRHGLDGEDQLLVDPAKVKLAPANQAKGKNVITSFALSPDGRMLAYIHGPSTFVGTAEIFVKLLPSGEPKQLTRHAENGPSVFP